jgi:beta-lactamase class A
MNYRVIFLLFASLDLVAVGAAAQPGNVEDETLRAILESRIDNFDGQVGLYVRHLSTGRMVSINADTLFPTASMIKIPILIKTFDAIERGDLDYDQPLVYRDSLLYEGVDILGSFRAWRRLSTRSFS